MARSVREATLQQLKNLVESDMTVLEQRKPNPQLQATETARDLKYVRERQMTLGF